MITKQKVHQIKNFIKLMPEIEDTLKHVFVDYLKLLNENEKLKIENIKLMEEGIDLLTEADHHATMAKALQEELDGLKTIH